MVRRDVKEGRYEGGGWRIELASFRLTQSGREICGLSKGDDLSVYSCIFGKRHV